MSLSHKQGNRRDKRAGCQQQYMSTAARALQPLLVWCTESGGQFEKPNFRRRIDPAPKCPVCSSVPPIVPPAGSPAASSNMSLATSPRCASHTPLCPYDVYHCALPPRVPPCPPGAAPDIPITPPCVSHYASHSCAQATRPRERPSPEQSTTNGGMDRAPFTRGGGSDGWAGGRVQPPEGAVGTKCRKKKPRQWPRTPPPPPKWC